MIYALNKLSEEKYFSVLTLLKEIKNAPNFPADQSPLIEGGRFELAEECIFIAPMNSKEDNPASPIGGYRDELQYDEFLDIRFHLGRKVEKKHIEQICDVLQPLKRVKDLDFRHSVLLGKHSLSNFRHYWAAEMFANAIRRRRSTLGAASPVPHEDAERLAVMAHSATAAIYDDNAAVTLTPPPVTPSVISVETNTSRLQKTNYEYLIARPVVGYCVGLLGGLLTMIVLERHFFRQ